MEEKDKVTSEECTADSVQCDPSAEEAAEVKDEKNAKKEAKAEAKAEKAEAKKLRSRVAELEKELEEERAKSAEGADKYLRTLAEYENFRRRSREERDALYADAVGESVKELLPIIDNLKLAARYEEGEKLAEGVKLILKTVPVALEKLGVEEFGAVGEQFDPNIHNAVLHEETDEFGENEIMDVLQCGYRRGDKILRFAMVKVAN